MDEGFVEGGRGCVLVKYTLSSLLSIYIKNSSKEYLAVVDEGGGEQNQDSCFHLPCFFLRCYPARQFPFTYVSNEMKEPIFVLVQILTSSKSKYSLQNLTALLENGYLILLKAYDYATDVLENNFINIVGVLVQRVA